jgi:SAM-dependent methyltransferase
MSSPDSITSVHHPIFARFYARVGAAAEKAGAAQHRDELLADVRGRVIEVGAGTGLNFAHYPTTVTEVVAIEPEPSLRQMAERAATAASVPIVVMDGVADSLPVETAAFDVGVASLVLCSVPGLHGALAELYRVIRPGGELRFYEHVRSDQPKKAKSQDRADHIWPWFAGGCHPNRNTLDAIRDAGFTVEEHRQFLFQPCLLSAPVAPHILGRATRPATGGH